MEAYDGLIAALKAYSKELGVYLILRIQQNQSRQVLVNNGRTQEMSDARLGGISFQVFSPLGGCGFATSGKIELERAKKMLKMAAEMAFQMEAGGRGLNQAVFRLAPLNNTYLSPGVEAFFKQELKAEEAAVLSLNQQIGLANPSLAVETQYRTVLEQWRVVRSDGTDLHYQVARFSLSNLVAARGNRGASARTGLSGGDCSQLFSLEWRKRLEKQTQRACCLAQELLQAPKLPAGRYKILLDYAMAKGLAHEAFGHAAETDGMQTSILADEAGRFQVGRQVAPSGVSIIDEPLEGDYAYQPYSPNGEKRKRAEIVKNGKLTEALADVFSAGAAGVASTGADRAESYRHIPLPRMSNIRIEVNNPLPLDKPFEEVEPLEVYQLLKEAGYLEGEEEILYLSGYKGGQVKPSQGEFVFHCSAIYKLGKECTLYQPEIFSGKILSVLNSIAAGVGPLRLDAQGTCGKSGQSVPSSGGSHYFILLNENDQVRIGGQ